MSSSHIVLFARYVHFRFLKRLTSKLTHRKALIRSAECFFTKQNEHLGSIYVLTKGVMFLGTPHRGSEQTKYADIIAKIAGAALHKPNPKLIEVLKQESDVLEAQRSSFAAISENLPVACIYETIPVTGIGIVSRDSFDCCCVLTGVRLYVVFALQRVNY